MSTYQQTPIRIALSTVSAPPASFTDQNTSASPQFFRSQGVSIQVGVFDSNGNPVDLSNLESLQFVLLPSSNSPYPLVVKTLLSGAFQEIVTAQDWENGVDQNATFVLTAADTDQGLDGELSQEFWGAVQGVTDDGTPITYGAGTVVIANSGLPVNVPKAMGENEQANSAGNFTVSPESQDHTEIVTVTGSARTAAAILSIVGAASGNKIRLVLNLPSTPGILINIVNGDLTGEVLDTIETNGVYTFATFDFVWSDFQEMWTLTLVAVLSSKALGTPITDNEGNQITDNEGNPITTS
jgi:hypothetical protein